MKSYEKIVKFVNKKNNVITTKEFKDAKIGFYYINKLIKDNYISRIGNGLYGKTDSFEDEYFIIQNRYKNAIFSYNTALFFLNKTEVTPNIIDITIPNDYNVSSINTKQIRVHYASRENIKLGVIKLKSPFGNTITAYNLERTICDIVKNKDKVEPEIFSKALKQYVKSKEKNLNNLFVYANKLRVEDEVRNYLEVML